MVEFNAEIRIDFQVLHGIFIFRFFWIFDVALNIQNFAYS